MFKNLPVPLAIAAGLLLLLILLSALFPLVGGDRLLMGFRQSGNGNFNQGMTPPQGNGSFNPENLPNGTFTPRDNSNGNGSFPQGQLPNGTRPQGNFSPSNSGLSAVWRILQSILYVVELALGVLAIVGMMLKKRWGLILGIVVSSVVLIVTIIGLFRMFSPLTLVLNILKLLLAAAVVALSLLPKTRQACIAAVE